MSTATWLVDVLSSVRDVFGGFGARSRHCGFDLGDRLSCRLHLPVGAGGNQQQDAGRPDERSQAAAGAGVAVRHGTILCVAAEAGATACYGTPFIADERTAWTMKIPEIYLVETVHRPGALASVLQVIADERLVIEHLQSLRRDQGSTLWEITVEIDEQASPNFYAGIDALPNARLVGKSDRVFNRHKGGKIHMRPSLQITTKQILRDIYTPGVARVCLAIREDPSQGGAVHEPAQHRGRRDQRHRNPRAWATSARSPACRSWKARQHCSLRSSASPLFRS